MFLYLFYLTIHSGFGGPIALEYTPAFKVTIWDGFVDLIAILFQYN